MFANKRSSQVVKSLVQDIPNNLEVAKGMSQWVSPFIFFNIDT